MSLSYTTGNPNNLTGGSTASMTDISGPFTDIKTFLTDGSGAVGDTILASPTNAVWRTVTQVAGYSTGSGVISTTPGYYAPVPTGYVASGAASTSGPQGVWSPPTAGELSVAGKTTRLRIRVVYLVNNTAPGITITWGFYPITAIGGSANQMILTLGTVIAGSTVSVTTPAGPSGASVTGPSFDLSLVTGGNSYIIGVVGSGNSQAANSLVSANAVLEMRHT